MNTVPGWPGRPLSPLRPAGPSKPGSPSRPGSPGTPTGPRTDKQVIELKALETSLQKGIHSLGSSDVSPQYIRQEQVTKPDGIHLGTIPRFSLFLAEFSPTLQRAVSYTYSFSMQQSRIIPGNPCGPASPGGPFDPGNPGGPGGPGSPLTTMLRPMVPGKPGGPERKQLSIR